MCFLCTCSHIYQIDVCMLAMYDPVDTQGKPLVSFSDDWLPPLKQGL